MDKTKICSCCRNDLPLSSFSKCKTNNHQRYCKKCKSMWVKNNRENINKTNRLKYSEYKNLRSEKYASDCKNRVKRMFWRRTRIYKSLKDSGFCFKCGTTKDLCLHHIDNNPLNNTLDNIQILCRKDHSIYHSTIRHVERI